MTRSIPYFLLSILILTSCDAPFELDLNQSPPKIVIEGLVTDRPGMQFVKVTKTTDFYSTGSTPRITDASITVTDDLGSSVSFVHNPRNHSDSMGIYLPAVPFAGEIGRHYKLVVVAEGQTYEAEDDLTGVIPIDSLTTSVDEDEMEDPEVDGRFYEVLMFAREPQDEENFYLFKFFRNDSLTYSFDTDVYYSDDDLLAEQIDGVPAPIYYGAGDLARIDVFSLSREGFVYYDDLFSLLNGDAGGMFGPIPASPRTNLTNGAMGFFQVSAVSSEEIKVE